MIIYFGGLLNVRDPNFAVILRQHQDARKTRVGASRTETWAGACDRMPFAGENYALFDDCSSRKKLPGTCFFEDRKCLISCRFRTEKKVSALLENELSVGDIMDVMRISFSGETDQYVKRATDKSARKMGEAPGPDSARASRPDSYNSFLQYLRLSGNHLYT